jgi:hypothetical protein
MYGISTYISGSTNSFSLKYINQAMERMKAMPENPDRELTVLEKLLITDPDPKTAMVMALDMMAAGIDTVRNSMKSPSRVNNCLLWLIKKFLTFH